MVHNNEVRTMEHIEDYIKKELKGLDLTAEDEALDVISDVYIVSNVRYSGLGDFLSSFCTIFPAFSKKSFSHFLMVAWSA